jgi:peptide/nickel transport system permease protein
MKAFIRNFARRKIAVAASIVIIAFILTALIGPFLLKYDPNAQDLLNKYQMPSTDHILGTDNLGRDIATRMVYGARISLLISFCGVMIGALIGVIIGVCAGYFGGVFDTVISGIIDILLAFPGLLLAIVIISILGSGVTNTMLTIAFYSIPKVARLVRGSVLAVKQSEYIQACRTMGASHLRIITLHIIPNIVSVITVDTTLSLGYALLTASGLSFLGIGVQPPNPEWGAMLSEARVALRTFPLGAIVPGVAITLVVLSFSLVGDGIRDVFDPKLKRGR